MQTANCHLRLGGNVNNEILKSGVTVAEIAVLRSIHGGDAVVKIAPTGNDKRPHATELDRLKRAYGDKVVSAAFPGIAPKLPVTFKDIGMDVYADDKPASDKQPRGAQTGSQTQQNAGDDAGHTGGDAQE